MPKSIFAQLQSLIHATPSLVLFTFTQPYLTQAQIHTELQGLTQVTPSLVVFLIYVLFS